MPAQERGSGVHAARYDGTGSVNNPRNLPYSEEDKLQLKADLVEIMSHGYTIDRAVKLLGHWATSPDKHRGILPTDGKDGWFEGPHATFGRAVPARKQFYIWKDEDAEFKAAWEEAYDERGKHALEDHAHDMAFAGDSKLVMFLLKARDPKKYANFGAMGGGSYQVTISPSDADL